MLSIYQNAATFYYNIPLYSNRNVDLKYRFLSIHDIRERKISKKINTSPNTNK